MTMHLMPPKGSPLTECGLTAALPGSLTTDPDQRTCTPCRDALIRQGRCPACLEKRLEWGTYPHNLTGVADGRLTLRDVETIFYLACSYCSETVLSRVDPDTVAVALTKMGWTP